MTLCPIRAAFDVKGRQLVVMLGRVIFACTVTAATVLLAFYSMLWLFVH
jgi:hypothetical protein